jgi:phosphoglycerate dehydrogenase-like enzyme
MLKVLVDVRPDNRGLQRLRDKQGIAVRMVDEPEEENPRPLPVSLIKDVHALFCSFPPTNIADMEALRFVQLASAGYDQILGLGLAERGVRASNALGVFDVPIAEWVVAMMVNLLRDLRTMIRNQEQGIWDRGPRFQRELRGLTVGLWGYGSIGRQTARLCKALGMIVHTLELNGIGPRPHTYCVPGTSDPQGLLPDRNFNLPEKEEFLRGLDFLVLAMPLTPRTQGIVGEAELRTLRPTAYLLNPARGPLVQEQPLLRALAEGWIAGAALDTHYHYPMPPDHPLWRVPNVIMTPHIAGSSGSPFFLQRVWDVFAENIERLEQDQPLLNELKPEQLRTV